MPVIIVLKDIFEPGAPFGTLYFLLKEDIFPREALDLLKQRIHNTIKFENPSKEDIVHLAEETIEEFNCTLIPYSLYILSY